MSVAGGTSPQQSSSPDLSSPPSGSPPPRLNGHVLGTETSNPAGSQFQFTPDASIVRKAGESKAAKDSSVAPKRRKKKDPDGKTSAAEQQTNGDAKLTKPRIKRGTGPRAMKKKAEEEARKAAEAAAAAAATVPSPHHIKINDGFARPQAPTPAPKPTPLPLSPQSENGNHEAIHTQPPYNYSQHLNPQPRPSSGQNYDPIRSSTIAPRPASPMNAVSTPPKPTASLNATRSPSIPSLIDPPETTGLYNAYQQASKREHEYTNGLSHEAKRPRLSPPIPAPSSLGPGTFTSYTSGSSHVDNTAAKTAQPNVAPSSSVTIINQITTPSSTKPTSVISKGPSPTPNSPKPTNRKEAPPLPGTGSGLLTGAIFGATGGLDESASERTSPTVVINVPLVGEHQYINFTRLAEEKYGFDALHPRLAAQRERRARVAAAGAALERVQKIGGSGMSADDMSEDLSIDDGDNSNVEMGGMSKSGEDADKTTKKKRVMKEDMYDVDDDFIDDTEQAWEEQAAVSMDGFFVYSGPLVPDGEEAKVERSAESAPKRGRGAGRGSRGGGTGRGGRASASAAAKDNKDEKEVKKRVRRSREQIERDKKEAEERKAQKEKITLLASKPAVPPLPSQPAQLQFQAHQMTA